MIDKMIIDADYKNLEKVMINPKRPNKNKGEVCSLAYAKATGIPVFATDEMDLQPIIDKQLNTGIDDITCIRIVDIIVKARDGEVSVPRKVAKALWLIAGKRKEVFDTEICSNNNHSYLVYKVEKDATDLTQGTKDSVSHKFARLYSQSTDKSVYKSLENEVECIVINGITFDENNSFSRGCGIPVIPEEEFLNVMTDWHLLCVICQIFGQGFLMVTLTITKRYFISFHVWLRENLHRFFLKS